MVALVGSTFYQTARESAAQVIHAVARPVQAAPAAVPVSLGSCEGARKMSAPGQKTWWRTLLVTAVVLVIGVKPIYAHREGVFSPS